MNNYAFFKKKQDMKAVNDKRHFQEQVLLAQLLWLIQMKQHRHVFARERMHKLICYLLYKRHLRLQKQKSKKHSFWVHQMQHDDSSFHQYKL